MPLFGDKSADKLYAHLLKLGIQAEMLHGHPLQKVCTKKGGVLGWGGEAKSLGLVQVAGKNIGYVNIIRQRHGSGQQEITFHYFEYLVPLREIPSSLCWAVLVTKKRGLFRREVVNIEWRGGTLADTLNGDPTLKQSLLMEFQLNRPLDILVAPEPIYRCIRIETGRHLPSGSLFDYLDRVAVLTAGHVTEVNSQPETVLFEGKIEFNPHSKGAEVADCYVTDRHVRIESKEPFQVPLYMVEDCYVSTPPMPSFGAGVPVVSYSAVTLRYRDESGNRRKVEFEMQTGYAAQLQSELRNSYPRGITR